MNDTTVDQTTADPKIGPDPNRAKPPAVQASSALALHTGQQDWSEDQRVQLRSMGLEHATEADLRLLYHYAARTGLDPFVKQVYMVSRRTKVKVRVTNPETGNARVEEQDVDKFTVQVGIDGWRVIGTRAARRDGVRVGHDDVLWRGKGTGWQDYWDKDEAGGNPPVACKYTVEFDGVRVSATCSYAEYVQLVRNDGQWQPNSMWSKMPANQIAKCAEALAWRKAFPADYSGLVLEDAAQPHDVIDGEVVDAEAQTAAAPRKAGGASRNAARASRAQAANRAEQQPAEPPAEKQQPGSVARRNWLNRMFGLFGDANLTERGDQLVAIAELGELEALPEHRDHIADDTLRTVVTKLNDLSKAAEEMAGKPEAKTFEQLVDDVLRAWEVRQANTDEAQS